MKSDPAHDCVVQVLRSANALARASRRVFRASELNDAQFNILHILSHYPRGLSQRELSDLLVVDRSNVTLLLQRMEGRGWISRQDVPSDDRVYRVRLTPAGSRQWKAALPGFRRAIAETAGSISHKDLRLAMKVLAEIELLAKREASRP